VEDIANVEPVAMSIKENGIKTTQYINPKGTQSATKFYGKNFLICTEENAFVVVKLYQNS